MNKPNPQTQRTDGWLPEGKKAGRWGAKWVKGIQRYKIFSYKINKSWGCDV